jgi:hypothetical protein
VAFKGSYDGTGLFPRPFYPIKPSLAPEGGRTGSVNLRNSTSGAASRARTPVHSIRLHLVGKLARHGHRNRSKQDVSARRLRVRVGETVAYWRQCRRGADKAARYRHRRDRTYEHRPAQVAADVAYAIFGGLPRLCIDAATRLTIACPPIPRGSDGSPPAVSAADIMGMIGEYRLASTAVDIEALELAQRGRRITARRSSACPSIIRRRAALLCLRNVTRSRA